MLQSVKYKIGHLLNRKPKKNENRNECILFNKKIQLKSINKEAELRNYSIVKKQFYFSSKAKLIGIKQLDRDSDCIFNTLPSTSQVMQKYYQNRKEAKRRFRHLSSAPELTIGVDRNYTFHLEEESADKNIQLKQELKFNIQHISAYGSHFDYLDVFSIIVVDEILDYIPTCLVFKFRSPTDRHKTAEAFIETLNCISTDLYGVFSFDSSTDYLANIGSPDLI